MKAAVSTTAMVANAATRSLIDGSDFGDNVLSALPSVLGSMIFDGVMSKLTPKNIHEVLAEGRKRYGEGYTLLASNSTVNTSTVRDSDPHLVIVTGSRKQQKDLFTRAREAVEQDVRNLRMGVTDAIQSGIKRGNNAVGSFKVQSRAAVQRAGGEVRSFGGEVKSSYLNRVNSGIAKIRSGDATARAFENNTGFTGVIGRFGGGLEGVNGVIEYGLAAPLSAVDVLVGRPLNTATNNAIPQKFMGDAALTIAGAASLRPTATAARATVAVDSALPSSKSYSVAFETKLDASVWGRSDSVHFNRANAALDDALRSDPDWAAQMDELIPGVQSSVAKTGGRVTPDGWVWHHDIEPGAMQLVPSKQHWDPALWNTLHPDGRGGYATWAIPAGAPPRK